MPKTEKVNENLNKVTYNLVAPDLRKFTADFYEAVNHEGIGEAVRSMGLSVSDVNEALRAVKKEQYRSALSTNFEAKADAFRAASQAFGLPKEDADAWIEAQLTKLRAAGPVGRRCCLLHGPRGRCIIDRCCSSRGYTCDRRFCFPATIPWRRGT